MTYFVGRVGNVRLRRNSENILTAIVKDADTVPVLNRIGIEGANDNFLTGDKITISTDDPRGLVFFPVGSWVDGEGVTQTSFSAFINVNAAGGVRFFPSFQAAINNVRAEEYTIQNFTGDPLIVQVQVRDLSANVLGDVTSYEFNTDREALETTALNDKFKRMYTAGLISGSGKIDCLFNNKTSGVVETPLLALQLINRVDIGSEFDCLLSITDQENNPAEQDIFYEFTAMVTRSGLQVTASDLISCSIDFVTTGEIKLLVGRPSGYILKQDDDRIALNQDSLAFLLTEVED
jgi:sporulation protein YlmC with PRC-barrel domain